MVRKYFFIIITINYKLENDFFKYLKKLFFLKNIKAKIKKNTINQLNFLKK